jgi:Leucine-rich repeat (LRR) protein
LHGLLRYFVVVKQILAIICLLFLTYNGFAQSLKSWQWNEQHPLPYDYVEVGKLDVRGAKNLDSLLKELPKFKNIAWLNMWGLGIETLPETIFDSLTALRTLDLGRNELTRLPGSFNRLTKLTHLGLYQNQLIELPHSVYELQLLELRIHDNKLSGTFTISPEWKNLKQLNLAGNKIDSINGLTYLRKLERLQLTACNFSMLPNEFQRCRKLRYLYIDHNPIESLPKSLLRLPKLWYILLEKTNIPEELLFVYQMRYPSKTFDDCKTC